MTGGIESGSPWEPDRGKHRGSRMFYGAATSVESEALSGGELSRRTKIGTIRVREAVATGILSRITSTEWLQQCVVHAAAMLGSK